MSLSLEDKAGYFESAPGAIVISESDFQKALKDSLNAGDIKDGRAVSKQAYAADYGTKMKATDYAGAANNPATLGIIAAFKKPGKEISFSGNIFFVVGNPEFDDNESKLQATEYRIAAVELSGIASFVGTDAHFAQNSSMLQGYGRRCCGTLNICNPAIPGATVEPTQGGLPFDPTNTHYSLWDVRSGAGNPTIGLHFYSPSLDIPDINPQGFNCIQTHDIGCENITPVCDIDMFGFLINEDGVPDIHVGSNPCRTASVDIKKPPKWCTIAHTLDECRGRFPRDYLRPYAEREGGLGGTPALCTVAKPVTAEGMCGQSYSQKLKLKQIDLRIAAGWLPGKHSKQCSPAPVTGPNLDPRSETRLQKCVECNAQGECYEKIEKTPFNPVAGERTEGEWNALGFYKDPLASGGVEYGLDLTQKPDSKAPDKPWGGPPSPEPKKQPKDINVPGGKGRADALTNTKPSQSSPTAQTPAAASQPPVEKQDPVRLADGSFVINHTDLSFQGPARDLEFIRNYQSNWGRRSTLGTNWTHNWDVWLQPLNTDNIPDWLSPWCAGAEAVVTAAFFHDAGVTELYLLDISTHLYLPQAGAFGTLTRTDTNGWALRDPDGRIRVFDEDGDLLSDNDRFGNGFTVKSEPTPLFRLYREFCSETELFTRNESKYSRRNYMLAYLIGEAPRPSWNITEWDLDYNYDFLPVSGDNELEYAREYLFHMVSLAKTNHNMIDRIDGFRKKRPLLVKDDTGRTLVFNYYKASQSPNGIVNFRHAPWADLLQSVEGPGNTFVSFEYWRPLDHPVDLNEGFLSRVNRNDSNSLSNVARSMERWYEFKYESCSQNQLMTLREKVENSYQDFYATFMGCFYFDQYICDQPVIGSIKRVSGGDSLFSAHLPANAFVSEVTGRISLVVNSGEIESETRFISDPWDSNFGKVTSQRWGALASQTNVDPDSPDDNWQTKLPKTTFQYQDAGPGQFDNGDDLTDYFLPDALLLRYTLEVYTGEIPEGYPETVVKGPDGSCNYDIMDQMREKLPGRGKQLEYYELPDAEQHPQIDLPLKRTRLLPRQLVMAQVGDPTHNDLITGMTPDMSVASGFKLDRIVGRRKAMAANGNRICSWIRLRDRDGDIHYFGLNYRGQALVEAVVEDDNYIITERLVNADGLVVQERNPLLAETQWQTNLGYKYFAYDEIDPKGSAGWNEWLPVFWSRRANLLRIEEYAEGGFVLNDNENGFVETHHGRFQSFSYEPLFNQLKSHLTGIIRPGISSSNLSDLVANSYKYLVYDYQELTLELTAGDPHSIIPFLETLVPWGFNWLRTKTGDIDPAVVGTWQLPLNLYGKDLNDDGIIGNRYALTPGSLAKGVPVVIATGSFNGTLQRITKMGWAPHGQPAYFLWPDGEFEVFEYYSSNYKSFNVYGDSNGPRDYDVNSGYGGFLGRKKKLRNGTSYNPMYGPQEIPSQILTGPYQWIKAPGNDQLESLKALGLPLEIANDLVASFGTKNGNFIELSFSYDITGRVNRTFSPTGNNIINRDTDGRVIRFIDATNAETKIEYGYLGLPVRMVKFDTALKPIGLTEITYDAEGRTLFTCEALDENGGQQNDPDKSIKRFFVYSPEGSLIQQTEPEALVVTHEYNARKLTRNVIHTDTQTNAWRGTVLTYDLQGRIITTKHGVRSETDIAVLIETFSYDGLGRVVNIIDTRGTNWLHTWSYRDLLVAKKDQGNRFAQIVASQSLRQEQWKYDQFGKLINYFLNGVLLDSYKRTDGGRIYFANGTGKGETWRTYDSMGRSAWARDAAGTETIYSYNENPYRMGIVQLRKDASGAQIATSVWKDLDPRALPIAETSYANGILIKQEFDYDLNGHLIAQRDQRKHEIRYKRNWLGWVMKLQEDRERAGGLYDEAIYQYDKRGLMRHLTDPAGYGTSREYNSFGDLLSHNSGGINMPVIAAYEYDSVGRQIYNRKGDVEIKTIYDERGDSIVEQYLASNKWTTFLHKEYDNIGRISRLGHTNPSVYWLNEADRVILTERQYDVLGRVQAENTFLGTALHSSSNSNWIEYNGGWKKDVNYSSGAWLSTRTKIFDGAGRLVQIERSSALTTSSNTYFNWMGEFYTGRLQKYAWHSSPFKEDIVLDVFGLPEKITYCAIDLDGMQQPLDVNEGSAYCPGGWDIAACAKPLLEIEMKRDSLARIASLGWQFFHPQIIGGVHQAPNHPNYWRGYTYDSRGHLSTTWEYDNVLRLKIKALQNYLVQEGDLQAIAFPDSPKWTYKREEAVGGTLEITDKISGSTRFRLPTSRGNGHQLTQVEVNGNKENVYHNAQGQIVAKGQDQLVYHPLGQLAYITRDNQILESYLYDAEGRLTGVIDRQNLLTSLTFDGHQMIAALNNSGMALWEAIWGPGTDKLIEWIEYPSNKVYASLSDHRNSIVGLWNVDDNSMASIAEYTPEGRAVILSPTYDVLGDERDVKQSVCLIQPYCNFSFGSLWKSQATGLIWMRNRWYSSELEQFLSIDPFGYIDSYNLYNYSQSDSVNKNDPFGLSSQGHGSNKKGPDDVNRLRGEFLNAKSMQEKALILLKSLSLWGGQDTTPADKRRDLIIRNLSLVSGYAIGLGQNTTKLLSGDENVDSNAVRAETSQNVLAVGVATLMAVSKGVGLLNAVSADSARIASGLTPTGKIFWGSWNDYDKVIVNGEEMAVVGDRLYTRHAVDRMQPSGYRSASVPGGFQDQTGGMPQVHQAGGGGAKGLDHGRSVSPTHIEDVIQNSQGVVQENYNISHQSGSLQVIVSPGGTRVITVITLGK